MVEMANGISSVRCNANYPKYIERKRQNAVFMGLASGTLGTSIAALHLTKNKVALKHPVLMAVCATTAFLGTMFGITQLSSLSKQMEVFNPGKNALIKDQNQGKAVQNDTVENSKNQEKEERAKRTINYFVKSNPVLNPLGAFGYQVNPNLESSPLDSPIVDVLSIK